MVSHASLTRPAEREGAIDVRLEASVCWDKAVFEGPWLLDVRLEASVCWDKAVFEGPWLLDVRLEASVCCDSIYVRVYLRKVEHK